MRRLTVVVYWHLKPIVCIYNEMGMVQNEHAKDEYKSEMLSL